MTNLIKEHWLKYQKDPDNWIRIPELNVFPQDVDFKGFAYQIVKPQSNIIHYRIFEIVKAVRSQAAKRFKTLVDLNAANIIFGEKIEFLENELAIDDYTAAEVINFKGCSSDELFAFRYNLIFYSIERCFLFYKKDKSGSLDALANVAVNLAEMMIEKPLDQETVKGIRSGIGRIAAIAKYAADPKQKDKKIVKECWDVWKNNPDRYKSKAAFARDMREKFPTLESQIVIERWCREWANEK